MAADLRNAIERMRARSVDCVACFAAACDTVLLHLETQANAVRCNAKTVHKSIRDAIVVMDVNAVQMRGFSGVGAAHNYSSFCAPVVNTLLLPFADIQTVPLPGILFSDSISVSQTRIDYTHAQSYGPMETVVWGVDIVDSSGATAQWVTQDDLEIMFNFEQRLSDSALYPTPYITGEYGRFSISMTIAEDLGTFYSYLKIGSHTVYLEQLYQSAPNRLQIRIVPQCDDTFAVSPDGAWAVIVLNDAIDVYDIGAYGGGIRFKETLRPTPHPVFSGRPASDSKSACITSKNTILISSLLLYKVFEFDRHGAPVRSFSIDIMPGFPLAKMAWLNSVIVINAIDKLLVYNYSDAAFVRAIPLRGTRLCRVWCCTEDGGVLMARPKVGVVRVDLETGHESVAYACPVADVCLDSATAITSIRAHEFLIASSFGKVVLCNMRTHTNRAISRCNRPTSLVWSRGKLYVSDSTAL